MTGRLYLCATPIGNLSDISLRCLETLRSVDLIAAEDTRNTLRLLNHFEIKKPLTSYHEFNKIDKGHELVRQLLEGKNIALVSDAGTPGISDPGEELVRFCREAGVEVTSVPGASACITALTMSGLPTRRFCFEGFLPTDKKERTVVLERLKSETRTTIFYEAPHRLVRTLEIMAPYIGERKIVFCRELTKRYEESVSMTAAEAVAYYTEKTPRGEFVLVVEGAPPEAAKREAQRSWREVSVQAHMDIYLEKGLSSKEAMKAVAADRDMQKREIYQQLLEERAADDRESGEK